MILYRFLQAVFFLIFKVFFKLKISGRHHVPAHGGAILASNHASYSDILLIGCGLKRRLRYVAKAELFKSFFFRLLWIYLGGIPIKRSGVPLESFKRIQRETDRGRLIVVFPEGTRSRDGHLRKPKLGIGMMVALSKVPVIPVYISGSGQVLAPHSRRIRVHPVAVSYGPPVPVADLTERLEGKELYEALSARIMDKIDQLRLEQPEEMNGKKPAGLLRAASGRKRK
jgi:1-acyl-sn-glycerol-3-phosphate acyltransferase